MLNGDNSSCFFRLSNSLNRRRLTRDVLGAKVEAVEALSEVASGSNAIAEI